MVPVLCRARREPIPAAIQHRFQLDRPSQASAKGSSVARFRMVATRNLRLTAANLGGTLASMRSVERQWSGHVVAARAQTLEDVAVAGGATVALLVSNDAEHSTLRQLEADALRRGFATATASPGGMWLS